MYSLVVIIAIILFASLLIKCPRDSDEQILELIRNIPSGSSDGELSGGELDDVSATIAVAD